MIPGYTIEHRGLSRRNWVTRILVYNWHSINEVDMISWSEDGHPGMEKHCVAIFKIKWK
jgi:hypothetical protein